MALENNGTVTSTEVTNAGILRAHLYILVDKGMLEHVDRGVYILPSVFEDEMYNLQTRFKRGIFSLETALFVHDLTDRTPITYSMTFPLGYNTSSVKKENIRCYRVIEVRYPIGIICTKSPGGNPIRVYNPERTLCDILTTRNNIDIQVITDAFKRYTRSRQKDIPLLSEYANLFQVDKKVQPYLDILL